MIFAIALAFHNALSRGIIRLYLLAENGEFLELENGLMIELEA
jgi:hypothetical protein